MSATAVSGRRATPRRKRIATIAATAAAVAVAGGTVFTVSAYAADTRTQLSGGNWNAALTTAPSVSATTQAAASAASSTAAASTGSPVWAASQSTATAAKAKATAQAKVQAAKAKAQADAKAKAVAASRAAERAKLTAAKSAAAAKADVSPVAHPTVSEHFGVPGPWAAGYHTGTDFAVNVGTPVRAITSGTVVNAGWQAAYGNTIVVKLSDGRYALYAHLSHIGVPAGKSVAKGAQLGLSGNTGNSTGPHLHFEIRTSNTYGAVLNPENYLKHHGVGL